MDFSEKQVDRKIVETKKPQYNSLFLLVNTFEQ